MAGDMRERHVEERVEDTAERSRTSLFGRLRELVVENRRLVVCAVCLLVFLVLLNRVLAGEILTLDRAAIALMVGHVRAAWLTPSWKSSRSWSRPSRSSPASSAIRSRPRPRCSRRGGAVRGQPGGLDRPQPGPQVHYPAPAPRRFPAPGRHRRVQLSLGALHGGHGVLRAARLARVARVRDPRLRTGLCALLCIAIVVVGFSRVYLGVHYASDVIAGFCASLIWLAVYTKVAGPLLAAPERVD